MWSAVDRTLIEENLSHGMTAQDREARRPVPPTPGPPVPAWPYRAVMHTAAPCLPALRVSAMNARAAERPGFSGFQPRLRCPSRRCPPYPAHKTTSF